MNGKTVSIVERKLERSIFRQKMEEENKDEQNIGEIGKAKEDYRISCENYVAGQIQVSGDHFVNNKSLSITEHIKSD